MSRFNRFKRRDNANSIFARCRFHSCRLPATFLAIVDSLDEQNTERIANASCAVSKSLPRSGDMQRWSIPGVTMRLNDDFNILIEGDQEMQEALYGKLPGL
jgi:hypothetical protein